MSSSLIGAIAGGIIATSIGVFAHYFIGGRRLKKRLCQVLCDELDYNIERLKRAVTLDEAKYSTPYHFLSNSYLEVRNHGMLRELPKEIRNLIEEYYSFLQFVNTYWLGCFMREEPTFGSVMKEKNPTEDEVAKQMDEVLPKLKAFCSNLRVYPHHDVTYIVRKTGGIFKRGL